jgi:hypothetical protein
MKAVISGVTEMTESCPIFRKIQTQNPRICEWIQIIAEGYRFDSIDDGWAFFERE